MSLNRQRRARLLSPLQLLFRLLQVRYARCDYKLGGAIWPFFQTDNIVLNTRAIRDAQITPMLRLHDSPIGINR